MDYRGAAAPKKCKFIIFSLLILDTKVKVNNFLSKKKKKKKKKKLKVQRQHMTKIQKKKYLIYYI